MSSSKKLLQAAAGSASGGAGGLNVEDVFSTYLYEGNGSSQIIENGVQNLGDYPSDDVFLHLKGTTTTDNGPLGLTVNTIGNATTSSTQTKFTSSSLYVDGTGAGDLTTCFDIQEGQIKLGRKDFTIEYWVYHNAHNSYADFGSWNYYVNGYDGNFGGGIGGSGTQLRIFKYDGQSNSAFVTASVSTSLSTWYHVAITRQDGTAYLFLDGVLKGSGAFDHDLKDSEIGGITIGKLGSYEQVNAYFSDFRITVGKARYTSNFTVPTAALPTDTLTTGEGGLVWTKQRSGGEWHTLGDTERGTTQYIFTNATNANVARSDGITSFNSDGYSLSNWVAHNESGEDYASWTFRKAPKFFDVVTYTGTGSAQNISHNLGSVPGMVITKKTSSTSNWAVYHRGVPSGGQTGALLLNSNAAFATAASVWNNTAPTSTHFTVGSADASNISGQTYVAYLFAHNDGDGEFGPDGDADIIKCGSFSTDGSGDADIDLGFEPQWVLVKTTSTTLNWYLWDTMRGMVVGGADNPLFPNLSNAEGSGDNIQPNSTGFHIDGSPTEDWIYIAIRRGPMAVPTDATEVFAVETRDGTAPAYDSGFPVDMAIRVNGKTALHNTNISARLTQKRLLLTDSTAAEQDGNEYMFDYMDGWNSNASADTNSIAWMWKRAPSFFDVVAYTGNGTAGRTVSHNLGVAPEMMWVKNRGRTGTDWKVYHAGLGASAGNYYLHLNETLAATANNNSWYNTNPTDTEFTLGGSGSVNLSGDTYIAYLFASVDGVSKVFSVTKSSGSDASVNCGFSAGPRFVLLKRTDSTGDWYVWDSERGIVAGNDPYLLLNSTAAEVTSTDYIDPTSNGFTIVNGGLADGDYIGYAVA